MSHVVQFDKVVRKKQGPLAKFEAVRKKEWPLAKVKKRLSREGQCVRQDRSRPWKRSMPPEQNLLQEKQSLLQEKPF